MTKKTERTKHKNKPKTYINTDRLKIVRIKADKQTNKKQTNSKIETFKSFYSL